MNKIIITAAVTAALGSSASAATTIGINLMRNGTTTPALNDGSEYGVSNWVDVEAGSLAVSTDGVDVTWDSTGAWNGGGNAIENGYNDNAGSFTFSGLSAWLAANGATSYTVQTIGASDTANNWFGDTELRVADTNGVLLDTLTNISLQRGASSISSSLNTDILFIDPTNSGTAPAGGAGSRTNVAGIIITANIPEPTSTSLLGIVGLSLIFRRRR